MLATENVLSTAPAKQALVAKTLHDYIHFFSYSRRHNHIKTKPKYMALVLLPLQTKKKTLGIKEVQRTFPSAAFTLLYVIPGLFCETFSSCAEKNNTAITYQSRGDIKTIACLLVTCFISQFSVLLRRVTAEGSEPVLGNRVKHSTDSRGIMR